MHAYIYIYMYICTYIYIYTYTHLHTSTYLYTHIYTHIHIYIHKHIHIYIYIYIYTEYLINLHVYVSLSSEAHVCCHLNLRLLRVPPCGTHTSISQTWRSYCPSHAQQVRHMTGLLLRNSKINYHIMCIVYSANDEWLEHGS